jgi:hypothetical protein
MRYFQHLTLFAAAQRTVNRVAITAVSLFVCNDHNEAAAFGRSRIG